jgi:hypothetical protein
MFSSRRTDNLVRPAAYDSNPAKLVNSCDVLLGCDSNDLTILIPVDRWSAEEVGPCVLVLPVSFQYSSCSEQCPWSHLEECHVVSLSFVLPVLMFNDSHSVALCDIRYLGEY